MFFLNLLLTVLIWAIFLRVILSWVSPGSQNGFTQFVNDITNPILLPIQKLLPKTGMLDFSPLAAIIILDLLRYALKTLF